MEKKFGFILEHNEEVKDVNSMASLYRHEKTGARLLHLKNDDNNKVFCIGFRTPPANSTGVAHIVEHCVLSGSRKYKTKEPFMDLVKGSLQTFLNAMTYPDKTVYPLASRNDKDFEQLMDVYLDAVFFPSMLKDEMIFQQEGWHYELTEKDAPMKYVGVVYNEMRGAMSSPESVLEEELANSIFPDTIYAHNSGGDPYVIPELSYEAFKAFHQSYYHPSNSYIIVYGDGDIDKYMKHMDEEYLSKFERKEIDSAIHPQKPFEARREHSAEYSLSVEENDEGRDFFAWTWGVGESGSAEENFMLGLLQDILVNSDAAPLKNALLEKDFAEDVFASGEFFRQGYFSVVAKNVDRADKTLFEETVEETLKKIVSEGLDKKLIESSLSAREFALKEGGGDFPTKGVLYALEAMNGWLYDHDPLLTLRYSELLAELKGKISTDYYERYIEKYLLNNPFSSLLHLMPKKGLSEERDRELAKKLQAYKESLSDAELERILAENRALNEMQLSEDSPEAKATIPKLSLSDVNEDAGVIDYTVKDEGFPIVYHEAFTSKISYFRLAFDMSVLDLEELTYAALLADLLGSVDTENYTYQELSNEIYLNTGGISFSPMVTEHLHNGEIKLLFTVSSKVLSDKIDKVFPLIREITSTSKFSNEKRLGELIRMLKSRIEMTIFQIGHQWTMSRVSSYYSKTSKYSQLMGGYDGFLALQKWAKNFEEEFQALSEKLEKVYRKLFHRRNFTAMIVSDAEDYPKLAAEMKKYVESLPASSGKGSNDIRLEVLNEGFKSSANVQYVSKGANLREFGYSVTGTDYVVSKLMSGEYLHNNIRAKGGAYGAGVTVDLYGNLTTFSYRDPNLKETLGVYDAMADHLKELSLTEEDLTMFIIGTVNQLDPPMTERRKGDTAFSFYLTGVAEEDLRKRTREVLQTKLADISARAEVYRAAMAKGNVAVLGNENKIEENKDVFKNIRDLMIK